MGFVAPVAAVAPFPGNGGGAGPVAAHASPSSPHGYTETAYRPQPGASAMSIPPSSTLTSARRWPRRCLPEFVEVEFERVMAEVFRV